MSKSKATDPKKKSARELALHILTKVETEQAYSNILIHQVLKENKLERVESALMTEIVYGTIQRLNTIDDILNRFITKGVRSLQVWVKNLLRLSVYQILYLDKIPGHAAVNEAVNLAKRKGHQGISGMVNGVLRNVLRNKDEVFVYDQHTEVARIALQYSHPEWMVARWVRQYGEQITIAICESNNLPPHTSIRVNRLKISREHLVSNLEQAGLEASVSSVSSSGIILKNIGNMANTPWYIQGMLSIQDESSMLVADILDPKPQMRVLDCCSAPGGKTTHIAEKMGDQGEIFAGDIHQHKQKLIEEQVSRLNLKSIHTYIRDASSLNEFFDKASFDRILLDAPCSGLGVIRRKPDLKWNKLPEDIESISALQLQLLDVVQSLLKPGGVLVYSTCTIEKKENEEVIRQFLARHHDFALDEQLEELISPEVYHKSVVEKGMLQVLPHYFHSDGFFIARLIKKT